MHELVILKWGDPERTVERLSHFSLLVSCGFGLVIFFRILFQQEFIDKNIDAETTFLILPHIDQFVLLFNWF